MRLLGLACALVLLGAAGRADDDDDDEEPYSKSWFCLEGESSSVNDIDSTCQVDYDTYHDNTLVDLVQWKKARYGTACYKAVSTEVDSKRNEQRVVRKGCLSKAKCRTAIGTANGCGFYGRERVCCCHTDNDDDDPCNAAARTRALALAAATSSLLALHLLV